MNELFKHINNILDNKNNYIDNYELFKIDENININALINGNYKIINNINGNEITFDQLNNNIFDYIIDSIDFNTYRILYNDDIKNENIIDKNDLNNMYYSFLDNIYDMTYNLRYINNYHNILVQKCNGKNINSIINIYYYNPLDDICDIDIYNYNIIENNNAIANFKKYYNRYRNEYSKFINKIKDFNKNL